MLIINGGFSSPQILIRRRMFDNNVPSLTSEKSQSFTSELKKSQYYIGTMLVGVLFTVLMGVANGLMNDCCVQFFFHFIFWVRMPSLIMILP